MDVSSDSSRCDLDSIVSMESLQAITDEFRFNHLSVPDMTNAELSKRVASLELDNERLRIDLENCKLELNAKNAANQGLKNKIAELYMEARTSMQEKQKLHNSITDVQCRLAAAENSTKWYQGQMHDVQASKKTLHIEIDTYQSMLRQKHQSLVNVTAKWKQLNEDYLIVLQKHKKEKDILQAEIESLKTNDNGIKNCSVLSQPQSTVPIAAYTEISSKLNATEEELQDVREELRTLEQRLISSEVKKASMENAVDEQRTLLSSMEDSLQRCQSEKTEFDDVVRGLRLQLQKLNAENERQQMNLLLGTQEREQVEDAIEQLRPQLIKMLAQHKLLKSRNAELEEKLSATQGIYNENQRLKSLSYSANASLLRRLRQERKKTNNLQKQLCQEQRRQQTLDKDLKDQLKSTKVPEDNLDEGYADGSVVGFPISSLPSPRFLDAKLLNAINDVLSKSKNFWEPIQAEVNELHLKLENYKGQKIPRISSCYNAPSLSSSNVPSVY